MKVHQQNPRFLKVLNIFVRKVCPMFGLCLLVGAHEVFAAEAPRVGRAAAARYFQNRSQASTAPNASQGDQAMWLHVGRSVNSSSYQWESPGRTDGVATNSFGFSFLFSEWGGMDLIFRGDINEFDLRGQRASKLSLLPVVVFPKVETRFPLYFGLGAGVGVYFQQLEARSQIALDYQFFMGARFLDMTPGLGFFIEYGLKNHVHILSEGQLNASVLSVGPIFTF